MPEVFFPLNSVGVGHLSRAVQLALWMRRLGRRPLIIEQGQYPDFLVPTIPGASAATFFSLPEKERTEVTRRMLRVLDSSQPSLFIEDTHPCGMWLPARIPRLLLVRPTDMAYMRMLRAQYETTYHQFLLCDAPGSPTWPFDQDETEEIGSWQKFCWMGPIFRRPTSRSFHRVKEKYHIADDSEVYLFSLGGGGEQLGTNDRKSFVTVAESMGASLKELRPQARLLFVGGPLFPAEVPVPAIFEKIHYEPKMPELIASVRGAVIRPGFNTTWECIAAGTPFLSIPGSTYMEPVEARTRALHQFGLALPKTVGDLVSREARKRFITGAHRAISCFSGRPNERFREVLDQIAPKGTKALPSTEGTIVEQSYVRRRGCLHVVLQSVTSFDSGTEWILKLASALKLRISCTVIPYLSLLTNDDLDTVDPWRSVEILMEGFAGLPHDILRGGSEFASDASRPGDIRAIERGYQLIRRQHAHRFRGGLAVRKGEVPEWLRQLWGTCGGEYVVDSVNEKARRSTRRIVVPTICWREASQPASLLDDLPRYTHRGSPTALLIPVQALRLQAARDRLESFLFRASQMCDVNASLSDEEIALPLRKENQTGISALALTELRPEQLSNALRPAHLRFAQLIHALPASHVSKLVRS